MEVLDFCLLAELKNFVYAAEKLFSYRQSTYTPFLCQDED